MINKRGGFHPQGGEMDTLVIRAIDTYCVKKDEFITKANFCEVYNKYTGVLIGKMDYSRYKMLCQGPDLLHFEIDNSKERNMRR